jgi:hypothetical protein
MEYYYYYYLSQTVWNRAYLIPILLEGCLEKGGRIHARDGICSQFFSKYEASMNPGLLNDGLRHR